jgi:Zn-finger protein
VLIDIDKIVVVNIDSENGLTIINCTDQVIVTVDDSVDEIKEKIEVTRTSGGSRQAN